MDDTASAHPAGPEVAGWTPPPAPGPATLAGRLVRIEPLSAARHAAALHAANGDTEATWDFMGCGPFAGLPEYAQWMRSVEARDDPCFHAVLDAAGRPLGVASYLRIDRGNGVCEVGNIVWSPGLRRRPEATEAMYLMAERAFALGYRRYEWKCNAANLPSRRAAQRLGFSFEGTFRQHMIVKGRSRDTAWFAMTDGDWVGLAPVLRRWLDPANFDASGRQREPLSALTRPLLKGIDPALG